MLLPVRYVERCLTVCYGYARNGSPCAQPKSLAVAQFRFFRQILCCICEIQRRKSVALLVLLSILSFVTGCSTSFKYTPRHDQIYNPVARQIGLAIARGQDSRPVEEIRPAWTKNAEAIVAQALSDEVKHGKLFQRVKVDANRLNPKKYSTLVQFRVGKFECYDQADFLQSAGRDLLQTQVPGFRGSLIAASIPIKYVSEVEIEFTVLNVANGQSLFTKTYSATRSDSFNGYQGENPEVHLTSATLEAVLTQFLTDLANLPPNQGPP